MIQNIISSLKTNFSNFDRSCNNINKLFFYNLEYKDYDLNNSNLTDEILKTVLAKNLVKTHLNVIKTYDEVLSFVIDIKK